MVNRNKHQQPVVSEYGGDHLRSIFHTYHGTWFVSRPTNLNKSWWFIWQSHLTSKILKAAKCVGHNPNYEPTNGISPSTSREFEGSLSLVYRPEVTDSNKPSTRSTIQRNGADRARCDPMFSGIYIVSEKGCVCIYIYPTMLQKSKLE